MDINDDHEFNLDFNDDGQNPSSGDQPSPDLVEAVRVYRLNKENEEAAPGIRRKAEMRMVALEHRDRNTVIKRLR